MWNVGPKLQEELKTSRQDASNELRYITSLPAAEGRKRIMFLFFRDFLTGPARQIVDAKDKRDRPQRGSVSSTAKMVAWAFLFAANAGMFSYVMLFGSKQSTERQRAWVFSYFTYLMLDIFLFSMAIVLWTHLFLPSCAGGSVAATKGAVFQKVLFLSLLDV